MQNHDANRPLVRLPVGRGVMRARRGAARLTLLLLPLLLGAAGDAPTDIVAQQGAIKFSAADIRGLIDHADPQVRAQVQANPTALADFVRDRLLRQNLLAEAHAANWDQNADVIARINDARDTIIAQTFLASRGPTDPTYPSQAEVAAAYEANKARFSVPKQFHVAQIAILVPAGASKEVDEAARRKALGLREQALKPMADFGALASQNSQDRGSAEHGGDMGWVREDALVPVVHDAVVKLSDNGIAGPVRSTEAWHVVKLYATKPATVMTLEQAHDSLVLAMQQARAQQTARAYIDALVRKDPMQLDEIDLARRVAAAH
jgi:parvulin-like peptidyl-prolyl isomerase